MTHQTLSLRKCWKLFRAIMRSMERANACSSARMNLQGKNAKERFLFALVCESISTHGLLGTKRNSEFYFHETLDMISSATVLKFFGTAI